MPMSASPPVTAYLALGSNLGDRRAYLDRAIQALGQHPGIAVTKVSSYHETAPVGGPPGQGAYLNAAAEVQTDLAPDELLRLLLDVERGLGRVRRELNGPRTLDLDLLLYGDRILEGPGLIVPHPRMHERSFVLAPLAEIAPNVVHPVLSVSVADLLEKVRTGTAKTPFGELQAISGRDLLGRRALVTGSTGGIGRAIALELAAGGADVLVHGRRAGAAEEAAGRVQALGVRSESLLADLHTADACRALVRRAWETWGKLDIWVNNAGADTLVGPAANWPFEQKLGELLAVDLTATVLLSRDVGGRMKAAGGGVVLTLGWDQAEIGMEGDSGQLFGAVKAAVMAFSKSLALTLAPEVRVNCLAPGWIRTAWGESASQHWQDRVVRETPLGRWGTPEDVAAAARWLVSPAAAFLTGQVVRVNGGAVR
jgi:2-amino-4-hydroxy-6-hydroxymethyldihydropteridine diphosphokinase